MIQIKDSSINNIVRSMLGEFLLDGVVVAGGFAAALLAIHIETDPMERERLSKHINFGVKNWATSNFTTKYGDVDFWLLKGYGLEFEVVKRKELFGDKMVEETKFPFFTGITHSNDNKRALTFARKEKRLKAHEFVRHMQLIKDYYNDVDDILDRFDLDICKVAWYDDVLYADEKAVDSITLRQLSLSKDPMLCRDYEKYASVYRYLKYAARYSLQPDDETLKQIVNVTCDAIDYVQDPESLLRKEQEQVISFDEELVDLYRSTQQYLDAFCNAIIRKISLIMCFDNFKPSYAMFLINSKEEAVKVLIGDYLKLKGESDE